MFLIRTKPKGENNSCFGCTEGFVLDYFFATYRDFLEASIPNHIRWNHAHFLIMNVKYDSYSSLENSDINLVVNNEKFWILVMTKPESHCIRQEIVPHMTSCETTNHFFHLMLSYAAELIFSSNSTRRRISAFHKMTT